MKITTLCRGANMGKNLSYSPGDQFNWRRKDAQPLVDAGQAVEGHIAISPEAAQLCRDEGVDPREVEATGEGGRVLVSDVRSHLEPQEAEEPAAELDEPEEEGEL